MRSICLSICYIFGLFSLSWGQSSAIAQWSFESEDKTQKSGESILYLYPEDQISGEEGVVGKFLRINGKVQADYAFKDVQPTRAFSISFWMRMPKSNVSTNFRLFSFSDNSLLLGFQFPQLIFFTSLQTASGNLTRDQWGIKLDGTGREGFQYYADGQWHHWVVKYDPERGKKEIWIDGELPDSFSKTLPETGKLCHRNPCSKTLIFSHHPKYNDCFIGDLDEVIIYDDFISTQQQKRLYRAGKVASHAPSIPRKPKAENVQGKIEIDPAEYAPGHPRVQISALDQLSSFPLPRYQVGHQLHRHYNWIEPMYLGGYKSPGIDAEQSRLASTQVQEELATNWNYTIIIHNAVSGRFGDNAYIKSWAELANRYPDIPLGITTLWGQVILEESPGKPSKRSNVYSQNLGLDAYIKNSKGQAVDRLGAVNPHKKSISPILPDHYIIEDAQKQGSYLRTIQQLLTRPISIINENGEVPYSGTDSSVLAQDPAIVADKKKLGIESWIMYQAVKKTHQRSLYRYTMLKTAGLSKAEFSWYAIDGGPLGRYPWKPAREIQKPRNGQYYSTPDFYPRWPHNWYKWAGAWRGWKWIDESRKVEILAGDHLCSPFVAAGWSSDPERNIRPSQYLGLLKNLGVVGAEFFYPGFFNVSPKDVANPINYVWQTACPSYAQAISSRYEEILRNGNVLMDKQGVPIITAPISNPQALATVRKHREKDIYIIATTIQPLSNEKGVVPDELALAVQLPQERIQILSRRQGSVYYYDKSNPSSPIFYQLDTWHEAGHPWYWSKDFEFEAEVFDFSQELQIKTERPRKTDRSDFTTWTSYLEADGEDACAKYMFEPRSKQSNSFELRIRARKVANSSDKIEIILDDQSIGTLSSPNSSEWKWYTLKGKLNNLSLESHMLSVHLPTGIHLDQILLKQK